MAKTKKRKIKIATNSNVKSKSAGWVWKITIASFFLCLLFNLFSESTISKIPMEYSLIVLVLFIVIGVMFDLVGVAVTAAEQAPFHSMNARKIKGAASALFLIRNSDRVSNICSDVIGDICNIISGSGAALIIAGIMQKYNVDSIYISVAFTSIVACVTIGSKAVGKSIGISRSNEIVYRVALCLPPKMFKNKTQKVRKKH